MPRKRRKNKSKQFEVPEQSKVPKVICPVCCELVTVCYHFGDGTSFMLSCGDIISKLRLEAKQYEKD